MVYSLFCLDPCILSTLTMQVCWCCRGRRVMYYQPYWDVRCWRSSCPPITQCYHGLYKGLMEAFGNNSPQKKKRKKTRKEQKKKDWKKKNTKEKRKRCQKKRRKYGMGQTLASIILAIFLLGAFVCSHVILIINCFLLFLLVHPLLSFLCFTNRILFSPSSSLLIVIIIISS